MQKEKVMEWVQKLVTKAMHPGTPKHEVDACENKAAELMARYKITMTQATQSQESSDPFEGINKEIVDFIVDGRSDWGYYLAMYITNAFECKSIVIGNTKTVCFLGYQDDIDTCKWFFDYLQIEIYLWAEKNYTGKKERNAYAHGMSKIVGSKLKKLYKKVEEILPSDCRDLIVVKKKKVTAYMNIKFPGFVKSGGGNIDITAFRKGLKDGENLDLANHNRDKVSKQAKIV